MKPTCKTCQIGTKLSKNHHCDENNVIDLDPSKAWIRNIGVGSSKTPTRRFFCPNHSLVQDVPTPKSHTARRRAILKPNMPMTPVQSVLPATSRQLVLCSISTIPRNELPENEVPENLIPVDMAPKISPNRKETPLNDTARPSQTLNGKESDNDKKESDSDENEWAEVENTVFERFNGLNITKYEVESGEPKKNLCESFSPLPDGTFTKDSWKLAISGITPHEETVFKSPQPKSDSSSDNNITSLSNLAENTLIPFNSTELSTISARIDNLSNGSDNSLTSYSKYFFGIVFLVKIYIYLEKIVQYLMSIFIKFPEPPHIDAFGMDQTLLPTYSQFKHAKSNKDWTIISRSQLSSKTTRLNPVYMSDDDVNRLMQSGHIIFGEGKLRYKEPSAKVINNAEINSTKSG